MKRTRHLGLLLAALAWGCTPEPSADAAPEPEGAGGGRGRPGPSRNRRAPVGFAPPGGGAARGVRDEPHRPGRRRDSCHRPAGVPPPGGAGGPLLAGARDPGDAEAGVLVDSSVDEATGLPVHSLYGETRKPTPAMLDGSRSSSSTSRTWAPATTRTSTPWRWPWRPPARPGSPSWSWTARTRWGASRCRGTFWIRPSPRSWGCTRFPCATG
jgi:hypothetical protein